MRAHHLFAGLVAVTTAGLVVHAGGCDAGSATAIDDRDAGGPAVDGSTRARDGAVPPEEDASTTKSPLEGWAPLTEYDPRCGFYYPTDAKYLPAPVAWEPCSALTDASDYSDAGVSGPPGMVCERVVTHSGELVAVRTGYVENGRVYLLLTRSGPGGPGGPVFQLVAEADGPVHTALFGKCSVSAFDEARFGRVLQRFYDPSPEVTAGGAIGGTFDQLKPRVYFPSDHLPHPGLGHMYSVGRTLFIESAHPDTVYSFDTGAPVATIVAPPEDADLDYSGYGFQEDTLYWTALTSLRSAVKVWTRERGIFTLYDHGTDYSRGIAGFSTDGVDMVWMEGRGRTNYAQLTFDVYEYWTAKYTLDPATVTATKRRLRTEVRPLYGDRYTVGCGFAAMHVLADAPTPWGQQGFRLVRLSDGVSWRVLTGSPGQQAELALLVPFAVDCTHVYVRARSVGTEQVTRIRIDSLGEGTPPD